MRASQCNSSIKTEKRNQKKRTSTDQLQWLHFMHSGEASHIRHCVSKQDMDPDRQQKWGRKGAEKGQKRGRKGAEKGQKGARRGFPLGNLYLCCNPSRRVSLDCNSCINKGHSLSKKKIGAIPLLWPGLYSGHSFWQTINFHKKKAWVCLPHPMKSKLMAEV
jgi:hypothetical protein